MQRGAKIVTRRAEEYRRYARQCLEIAPTFQDEEARATLLGFAQTWLRLAHLAFANRQIAELAVQIARQRVIVKYALDTGQRSEMEESLLHALEESLRIFEKHRIFLLSCSVIRPSMSLDRQGPSSEIRVSMSQRSRPTSHSVSIGQRA
jgi:N-acyl-D-aspartate/D-glutamate deacylase